MVITDPSKGASCMPVEIRIGLFAVIVFIDSVYFWELIAIEGPARSFVDSGLQRFWPNA